MSELSVVSLLDASSSLEVACHKFATLSVECIVGALNTPRFTSSMCFTLYGSSHSSTGWVLSVLYLFLQLWLAMHVIQCA